MKVDYNKIIKIKNIKDLKKISVNKQLYENNYLFHYLILLNNLDGLKLQKFPIYITNNNGYNGIHLAAEQNNLKILNYLIIHYNEYIYNRTLGNLTFINLLPHNNQIKIIKKFKNLKLKYLFINEGDISYLLQNVNYNDLLFLLKKNFFYKYKYLLCYIFYNNNLSTNNIIEIFKLYSPKYIEYICNNTPLHKLLFVQKVNEQILKYLFNTNIIDFTSKNIISKLLFNSNINFTFTLYIIDNILISKPLFYFNQNNIHLCNLIHYFIILFHINKKIDDDIKKNLLLKFKKSLPWNSYNYDKYTPLHLIILYNFDFDFFKDVIISNNIKINKKVLKNIIKTINNPNNLWIKLYQSLPNLKIKKNNVIIKKYKYANYNILYPYISYYILYILYILNKYDSVFIPYISPKDNIFDYPFMIKYNYSLNNTIIHPDLNYLINIQKQKNKKYGFVILSIMYSCNAGHANILIYDFKNMTIERFEPHQQGNMFNDVIDIQLNEMLTWNTKFTYINHNKIMKNYGFQKISNEKDTINIKHGDPEGFCMSWALWYFETKLLNENIKSKQLIKLLYKKLKSLDISFSEYIRSYSNYIRRQFNRILINDIKVNKKELYNASLIDNYSVVFNYFNNYMELKKNNI